MSERRDAWAWLESREDEIPESLRARLRDAVCAVTTTAETATDLAHAALTCMRAALDAGDDRSAALHLLAADALITHAAEAASLRGERALRELESLLGAGSLRRRFLAESAS